MPAIDVCHQKVVNALRRDGWTVSDRPFTLLSPINNLYIDIEAYRANDDGEQEIIVVEVKCFSDGGATMPDLYASIGQYLIYQEQMKRNQVSIPLYLAIPEEIYANVFEPLANGIANRNTMKLVVVDLEHEVIKRWIE